MDTTTTTTTPLMKPDEVAAILRIGRSTVYRLMAAGQIATVSVGVGRGRHRRITPEALRAYIARNEH